ncbi:MAG: hypothetical protein ACP5G1_01130 [Nanopusillaceae archaeon]
MRVQYILLASAFIIVLLSFLTVRYMRPIENIDAIIIGKNFKNEIIYIYKNFGYNYISDYTLLFKNYVENINFNFSFVCVSSHNLSLPRCTGTDVNCCYYFNGYFYLNSSILKYCDKNFTIYNPPDWICFCYIINKSNESYTNFFCI